MALETVIMERLNKTCISEAEERKFKKVWRRNLFADISHILIQNALLVADKAVVERTDSGYLEPV